MKKRERKKLSSDGKFLLVIIIIAAILLGLIAYFESNKYDDYKDSGNTTFGRVDSGFKGIYLSCLEYGEQEGFETSRFTKYIRFLDEDSIVIMVAPYLERVFYATEAQDILERVKNGGTVIILESNYSFFELEEEESEETTEYEELSETEDISETESLPFAEYFLAEETEVNFEECINENLIYNVYTLPSGGKFYNFSDGMTAEIQNIGLKESNKAGADFLRLLAKISKENNNAEVVFDEFYVGIEDDVALDVLGIGFILFLVQISLVVILFLLSKAVTFGAPVHVPSLEHRAELEHVESLSKLYKRCGNNSIAFDIHMEALLRDLCDSLEKQDGISYAPSEIIEMADTDGRLIKLKIGNLVKVYNNPKKKKLGEKKLKEYILYIEKVRKEL